MKKRAVLFDLDGTLIDSLGDICAILNRVRVRRGLPELTVERIRGFIGKGADHLMRGCFQEIPEVPVLALVKEYRDLYSAEPAIEGAPYQGVPETLMKLRTVPGLKLGVATNKPSGVARITLEHYLPGFTFDIICGPEDVSRNKPHPEHLLETLQRIDVAPADAWFIGDDLVDYQCAQAAGVRFFGACYGFGGVKVPADLSLGSFPELLYKVGLP